MNIACTHCGTVNPLTEMDCGETFAACSDECLLAIQAADEHDIRSDYAKRTGATVKLIRI